MNGFEILRYGDMKPNNSTRGVNVICGSSCDIDIVCCGDGVCCDWACCDDSGCWDTCYTGCIERRERF